MSAKTLASMLGTRMNRRSALASAAALSLAARSAAHAQDGTAVATPGATPAIDLQGEPDAVALLEAAVAAVSALETFAFELSTVQGSSTIFQGLDLKSVEGVVRRPLDIEATVTVGIPLGEISVTAVGLDGEFWVQDPLSNNEWISVGSDPQLQSLINPDTLLQYAVRLVQDAEITGTEALGGVETTLVEGEVDFSGFFASFGGDAEMVGDLLAEGAKPVLFWVDGENRVVRAEIIGPVFRTESDDVIRQLDLTAFNEPVEIARPEGV